MQRSSSAAVAASVALVVALFAPHARAGYTPGDVFAHNYSGEIHDVTPGGDFTGVPAIANVGNSDVGKMAFSADLSTMYVSNRMNGTVYAVDSSGFVSTFATGLTGPAGILRTSAGQLLVAEFDSGQVTDITTGGSFAGAAPFASNLDLPTDLAQLPDGRVMAAEYFGGGVSDITAGGVIGPANVFVSGFGSCTSIVVSPSGGLMAASSQSSTVWSVSPTGVGTIFGTGAGIWGLAYTATGQLLGADYGSGSGRILDISAGGDLSLAPAFVTNLPETNSLSAVPVPEPTSLILLAIGGAALRRG
jgi:hypothetical protein